MADNGPLPTIIDCDTGIDDALALLLAARSPELRLVGVTCVAGNVVLEQVVRNTLGVLAVAGVRVPVAAGAARPLVRRLTTATFFHGADGIGGAPIPAPLAPPVAEPAAAFLCRMAREHTGHLCLVAVGPLTNIALACRLDRSCSRRLRRRVVMGGAATVAGNVTPAAEANFYNDPEAASIVFRSGAPLTMVGLDVTLQTLFPALGYAGLRQRVEADGDAVAQLAARVLEQYLAADSAAGLTGSPLHDPLAVGALTHPALLGCHRLHVEIETDGRITSGQSVVNVAGAVERLTDLGDHDDVAGLAAPEPNCDVALEVDAGGFLALFRERLGLT